jgi:hypothetical protein
MVTTYEDLKIGLTVKNIKTAKNWMITEFSDSYSSVIRKAPDKLMVRISNGNRYQIISIEDLRKKYTW